MSDHSPEAHPPPKDSEAARLGRWLFLGMIGLAALSLAAAHAPPRVRLIGLYSIGYGVVAGYGLWFLAGLTSAPAGKRCGVLAFAAIAAGQVLLALETHRLLTSEAQSAASTISPAELMLETADPPADPQSRKLFDEMKKSVAGAAAEQRALLEEQRRFGAYLRRRIAPLGDWGTPWAELFWCAEVVASAAVGAWIAARPRAAASTPADV